MVSDQNHSFAFFCAKGVAKWRQAGTIAATLVVSFGLASCAVSPVGDAPGAAASAEPASRKQLVERRVAARWDALIKGDLGAAYEYLSPASRETTSLDRYKRLRQNAIYRSIAIDDITCDTEACTVKLRLTYDHKAMKGIVTPVQETWVFDHGQAWYVYRG